MVKHGWILLIVGGLLSIPVGIDAFTASPSALIAVSALAALGPLLILVGYDALADRSGGGSARSGLQVAGLGLLLLAGTEIASAVLPITGIRDAGEHLDEAYTVAAALVAVGSLVAGLVMFRRWLGIALPLLVGAAALALTLVPSAHSIPAFAVWAGTCVVLGLALKWTR